MVAVRTPHLPKMASDRSLVLVLGGTGYTGQSVVNGLLTSGNFVRTPLPGVF